MYIFDQRDNAAGMAPGAVSPQPPSSSGAASSFFSTTSVLAIGGVVAGVAVLAVAGLVFRRRLNQKNASASSTLKQFSEPPLLHPIDEITALGINLVPNSAKRLPPMSSTKTKPKILSTAGTESGKSSSDLDSPTSLSPTSSRLGPPVIPKRTSSISIENPGGDDARKRSIFAFISMQKNGSSKGSQKQLSGNAVAVASTNTTQSVDPSDSQNQPRNSEASNSSNMSSISIESDDVEEEMRYEVITAWIPQRFDELELIVGDTVIVYQIFQDGWCDGCILGSDETGAFPLACLKAPDWPFSFNPDSKHSTLTFNKKMQEDEQEPMDSISENLGKNKSKEESSTTANLTVKKKKGSRYSGILKNIDKFPDDV